MQPIELQPFIIKDEYKHYFYRDYPNLHIPHFETITYTNEKQSEASDSRPYTISHVNEKTQYNRCKVSMSQTDKDEESLQEQQLLPDETITAIPELNWIR